MSKWNSSLRLYQGITKPHPPTCSMRNCEAQKDTAVRLCHPFIAIFHDMAEARPLAKSKVTLLSEGLDKYFKLKGAERL